MFVGVALTGFEGDWTTRRSCIDAECQSPHDIGRCVRCQAGICEDHALIIGQAGQDEGTRE